MCRLETERLILRRFVPEDWRDLHQYLSDERVVRYEPYDPYAEEQSKEEALERSQDEAFWAVCLKENGKLIGNVYFHHQNPKELNTWEIGFVFNPAYHGEGYATEACRKIISYGFEQKNAYRIVAMCNPENKPSWKLLERIGMRREGHLLKNIYFKRDENGLPRWTDTYEYALLAEEWLRHW